MKNHIFPSLICVILLSGTVTVSRAGTIHESGISSQETVEVTVYNNNLGLIKDTRKISLPAGDGELRFIDVASHIRPTTVHVKSLDSVSGFLVLEQNYEYDLMNSQKLLDKYVGKKIKIVDWNQFKDRKDVVEATLLSNNEGQVYQIGEEIFLGHPGYKVLPELPENLIAKPTLTWLYRNKTVGEQKIQVSYLTDNINWRADYILLINDTDTRADLSGWVTLDNKSGTQYQNAALKLVAGNVNRIVRHFDAEANMVGGAMKARSDDGFREEAFFEYHIYDLERPTTIKDRQTKQISLLTASDVEVKKELLVRGSKRFFRQRYRGRDKKEPVDVYVSFRNEEKNRLGIPLPGGIVRLYKQDSRGSQQFIGEDGIEHTPKDETVRLKTGKSFDVVAERVQTDYRQKTSVSYETAWEITIRNHKEESVPVSIIEPLFGHWQILKSSHPYKKIDAFNIRYDVEVPADGKLMVSYRVRMGL
jgi:hypothetical protein